MNKPQPPQWKIAASLVFVAMLTLVSSASATLVITTTNQFGALPFTPTWTPASGSLIAGLAPSTATGDFALDLTTRNVNSLTSGGSLTISTLPGDRGPDPVGNTTTSSNYVSCGNRTAVPLPGSLIIYTLPASAYGYNVTNITVDSGWVDTGRDAQDYTVLYSTVANPGHFTYLTSVHYRPAGGSGGNANQVIINDASGGVIAANVDAVEFVMNAPNSENSWTGYGAITVQGTTNASVVSPVVVSITTSNESGSSPFTPDWTLETPNLIAGMAPSTASGNFTQESAGGINVLTDSAIGASGTISGFATCGSSGGTTLIYTLTNVVNGTDVTNIVTYSGWANNGRDGQYYIVSYSIVSAPLRFIPIATVIYLPAVSNAPANRVSIAMNNGSALASGVANIKFDFSSPANANNFNNNYQGYSEIIVQGTDTATATLAPPLLTQDTLPSYAETVVGDQVVFTAAFTNSPPVNLQWQYINTNSIATNDIAGATTATLTLNNLQVTNTGYYQLKAVNATNSGQVTYSSAAPLVVGSVPAPVNNIILEYAGQCGQGAGVISTNFYPTWTANTNNDLILGAVDGSVGTAGTVFGGLGNFGLAGGNGDPQILSDGISGYLTYHPGTAGNLTLDTCGPYSTVSGANYAGLSVTYTLNTASAPNGFDLTNIVVYAGWGDSGHNEQRYQVLCSTVGAPNTFIPMTGWVDYVPADPNGAQSATRTTLTPAAGVMAKNVYAVQFNFNSQNPVPKGSYSGYSEIIVAGQVAPARPILTQDVTPTAAEDVVGSKLTLTAGFINAASYQWLKNGTNLLGATLSTLTLNNLQLTDTATNGGYSLMAVNTFGTNVTASCKVYVDPAPTPTNNVVTAFAYQSSGAVGFSPTWDTSLLGSSLIAGQNPLASDTAANFIGGGDNAGGLTMLNDGSYGTFASNGTHPAFAACGPGAGNYVSYTLGANPNGYNVTNIQITAGWNDFGRDSQYYTVSYSTVANPTMFFPMVSVANNLSAGNGKAAPSSSVPTTVRSTITPASGVLASNVYAIYVDFDVPSGVPNGYSGYSEISVLGSPSATLPNGPVITTAHEETNNVWTVETPNLIANQLPSSYGPGVFMDEGCNETNLTDGVLGFGAAYGASCGADGTAVPWIIFSSANGWNLTNIVVYTLWQDYGRDGQYYNLSYSTLAAPNTFLPLASVAYNPYVPHDGRASGNRVAIAPPVGQTLLASNVAAVKFDFTPQGTEDFGWSGYSEIVLQGTNLPAVVAVNPPIVNPPHISGGNLILTGSGGTPYSHYTWLTTTNLSPPINWTTNAISFLDINGAFSNSIPVSATTPASFFRLRQP